ncbi:MAG TPA: sigma 54 modulation/S30EA ribosomal C-terminal domain-containing protein, partial [Stellaceae bacterium]|nr:sigma 54 modulation/S30EA ribosomal C-terminal domain-containing protein [Stellaceae bacterium]
RRLRDYHVKARERSVASERAMEYVLAPAAEENDEEELPKNNAAGGPAVIAEMSTELPHLTVGEAAMRMDLADAPVLLFRNRSHGELNVVYRRADGNIGWIDPELDSSRRTRRGAS